MNRELLLGLHFVAIEIYVTGVHFILPFGGVQDRGWFSHFFWEDVGEESKPFCIRYPRFSQLSSLHNASFVFYDCENAWELSFLRSPHERELKGLPSLTEFINLVD